MTISYFNCDDVEYGLRCGKIPIIIEGVHVWHETWEKKRNYKIIYYDMRNTLFVNEKYNILPKKEVLILQWKKQFSFYYKNKDYKSSFMVIKGMEDYLNGYQWLKKLIRKNIIKNLNIIWGKR